MHKGFKVKLHPNNKQKSELFNFAGAARFMYNWTLARQRDNYANGGKFIKYNDLHAELTQLKKQEDYKWLNEISNSVLQHAIKDACEAYRMFFKGVCGFPKFKSKKKSQLKFSQKVDRIRFTETHVSIEKISKSIRRNRLRLNWVKLAEKDRIPFGDNVKYYNPRVSFDGLDWYVSIATEIEGTNINPQGEGIGIDVGVKDLAICSDGNTYKNINKTKEVKKLKKRLKRQYRRLSKKQLMNVEETKNIIKAKAQLNRTQKRLNGIRRNHAHKVTSEIISRKPMFICLEDLNLQGLFENKHLSKALQEQGLYTFKDMLKYKALWSNIRIIEANRFFPSSKTCNSCGNVKKDLKLSDRTYKCLACGVEIDRDLNASLNLKEYGRKHITNSQS